MVLWICIVGLLVLPIVLFLTVAFSPALLSQGSQWFTLDGFRQALTGAFLQGALNSLMVGALAGGAATAVGGAVAWAVVRTDVPARGVWSGTMFALLLAPSYLVALGWERLLEPAGVLDLAGVPATGARDLFYGAFDVVVVLTVKGIPFAYLALSGALRGLGEEFEAAARVHGGGRLSAGRMVASLLAPACWSAFAIVFAESVSDFGVAATLANDAHFPVATYTLYNAINSFPVQFPVAAAVGWVLMGMAGLALLAQTWALRGRSYRVLGGRTRTVRRIALRRPGPTGYGHRLGAAGARRARGAGVRGGVGFADRRIGVAGGIPPADPRQLSAGDPQPSPARAAAVLGADGDGHRDGHRAARAGLRPAAVSAGSCGYRPAARPAAAHRGGVARDRVRRRLHLHLQPAAGQRPRRAPLPDVVPAVLGLPGNRAAVHVAGADGQRRPDPGLAGSGWSGARLRRAGGWLRTVLPLLGRPLLAAWVLTFAGTMLELPVSQLLYPPGRPPVAVGITKAMANYDFGGGTAMEVISILFALTLVAVTFGAYRLLAPAGWRHVGTAS